LEEAIWVALTSQAGTQPDETLGDSSLWRAYVAAFEKSTYLWDMK
jgi:hypothetical protein